MSELLSWRNHTTEWTPAEATAGVQSLASSVRYFAVSFTHSEDISGSGVAKLPLMNVCSVQS